MPFDTEVKRIRASLTVWFNGLCMVMLGIPLILEQSRDFLPPAAFGWILLGVNLFNLIVRIFFTSKPVTDTAANRG